MGPDKLAASELRRLARDVEADTAVLESLAREVSSALDRRPRLGVELEAYVAVRLHAWYTSLESILERAARVLEGSIPAGPASHQELLRGMTLPLPDVRPAVLLPARLPDLAQLLSFRHFFRHAYAVALDESHLRAHAERLARTHPGVLEDLEGFRATLLTAARALESDVSS